MTVSGLTVNQFNYSNRPVQHKTITIEPSTLRQELAAIITPAANTATQNAPESPDEFRQQAFLDQLMEQMLANRIGLDKQKFDEITEKIKETETEKDKLQLKPQSPARDSQIAALDARLEQFAKALEGLVEQASRNREQSERTVQATYKMAEEYRRAAYSVIA